MQPPTTTDSTIGPIEAVLAADHRRLEGLLARAEEGDQEAYEGLRSGLLRHIGVEEKIVLPTLRAAGHEAPVARQLKLDHSAIVAMLVPSPSPALLRRLAEFLALHDPLEEGAAGVYRLADTRLADPAALLPLIEAAPSPPLAAHFDGERAHAAIELLFGRAMAARAG
ncbi:MAG: hemerythrin domain-containing protein [Polyangiaceae bacterium]|nr:hemerythrin domain-containing protein [Polyangiaceae bacterium]